MTKRWGADYETKNSNLLLTEQSGQRDIDAMLNVTQKLTKNKASKLVKTGGQQVPANQAVTTVTT